MSCMGTDSKFTTSSIATCVVRLLFCAELFSSQFGLKNRNRAESSSSCVVKASLGCPFLAFLMSDSFVPWDTKVIGFI